MCVSEKRRPGPSSSDFVEVLYEEREEEGFRIDGCARKIERLGRAKAQAFRFIQAIAEKYGCQVPTLKDLYDPCKRWDPVSVFGAGGFLPKHLPAKKLFEAFRCGADLRIERVPSADYLKLRGMFCRRHLLCQACAVRRAGRELSRAMQRIEMVSLEGALAYMLTLTIKNGHDLSERYNHLRDSWRAWVHGRSRNRGRCALRALDGGFFSLEFKRGSGSGLWHPHLHAFVVCPVNRPLPVEKVGANSWRWAEGAKEWHEITGDSYIVDCRPVYGSDVSSSLVSGLVEVCKYAVKINGMDHADHEESFRVLSGRRLVGSFGVLYGLGLDGPPGKALRANARDVALRRCVGQTGDLTDYHFVGSGYAVHDFCVFRAGAISG